MTGIIIAMQEELAPYLREFQLVEKTYKSKKFYTGVINGCDTVICHSGVGKVNAAYACTLMIEFFSPQIIINTGTSGGLNRLKPFDIVVASKVCQHDCDTTALGDEKGLVGNPVQKVYFDTDKAMSESFLSAIKGAHYGVLACGDCFVADKQRAEGIVNDFDAIACDMESGAIGQVCYLEKVPFVAIRGISDGATDGAGADFYSVLKSVSEVTAAAVIKIIGKKK